MTEKNLSNHEEAAPSTVSESGGESRGGGKKRPKARDAAKSRGRGDAYIDEQLVEIYENQDGTMPDMKHFQKTPKHSVIRAFVTLLFACLFLAGVAWAGFFVWQPGGEFSQEDVIVSIGGPEMVGLGEEVRYRIRYRNDQAVPLSRVSLEVRYPAGFQFVSSSLTPVNDAKDEWALGSLDAEESGYIDLVGTLTGNVGDEQSFRIFLNYTPANFSSEFQKVATATTAITNSPITLTINGPADVLPGQDVTFTVVMKKEIAEAVPALRLEIDPGSSFRKKSSQPDSVDFHEYAWDVPAFETESTITVTGVFEATEEPEPLQFNLKSVAGNGVESHIYGRANYTVALSEAGSRGTMAVNGATSDTTVDPGEVLAVSVSFKNSSSQPMEHVVARAIFDAPSNRDRSILDWTAITNDQNGDIVGEQLDPNIRRGSIRWTEEEIPTLKTLAPGDVVTIDFQLPVKNTDDTDFSTFQTFDIRAVAEFTYEQGGKTLPASSQPLVLSVSSDVQLDVRDEVAVDGASETHRLTWLLNNSVHNLSALRLEAELYGGAAFDGASLVVPAGTAQFDENRKVLTWTIPTMTTAVDVLALQFTVRLPARNPSQTTLMSRVELTAKNDTTGKQIVKTGNEVRLQ